jgi:hypothetical protein
MNKTDKKINETIAAKVNPKINPPKVNAAAVDRKKVSKA